ncbi:Crp/Fnr family transcriptional regulator [Bradyrhizobium lablabi]|nr:cyclic nucleotide-binding domain-containing protein [Bradyrhizobium lablabi]
MPRADLTIPLPGPPGGSAACEFLLQSPQTPSMSQNCQAGPAMKDDASFSVLTGNNIDARPVKAGGVIFREGDEAHELFVIKSGEVRIQIGNRTITELTADCVFGEMALIDNEPRSATAIAITDVELVAVSEKQFLFLVSQTPYFALKVMRVLAQRLRATNKTFG